MSRSGRLLDHVDAAPTLAQLKRRALNYERGEVNSEQWHFDTWTTSLPAERPGPPEPGGVWETARELVETYEFSDPSLVRAVYEPDTPLLGRTMLLQARFLLLRFYLGVRVTECIDEVRVADDTGARERRWGWAYETLEGHLERGYISYEAVKNEDTGEVRFVLTAYSQRSPSLGPLTTLGWRMCGRRTQVRFYRRAGERIERAVRNRQGRETLCREGGDGLILAPSDARRRRLDRLSVRWPFGSRGSS